VNRPITVKTAAMTDNPPPRINPTKSGMGIRTRPARPSRTIAEGDLVVRMITDSSVETMRAAEDPHGPFSRVNHQEHVSRDDAICLVLRPPRVGERLPIPCLRNVAPPEIDRVV
jgi:hypothetical protein